MSYYGIFVDWSAIQKVLDQHGIVLSSTHSKKVKDPHVTLGHVNHFKSRQDMMTHFNEFQDTTISFKVTGVVYNEKCIAMTVELPNVDCHNKHPHITLATDKKTRPFYSNELLTLTDATRVVFDMDVKMTGNLELK